MESRKCVQCGKEFQISDSEQDFFKNQNLQLPKRCKECRAVNASTKNNFQKITSQARVRSETSFKKTQKNTLLITLLMMLVFVLVFGIFYISGKIDDINPYVTSSQEAAPSDTSTLTYTFQSDDLLEEHFIKHGNEFGYETSAQYLIGANVVINTAGVLSKIEAEDGDLVYYLESTNEFVVVSTEGYIRTYFKPEDGIEYYNRQ